jgi:class I fructose-bisphosphate aldolase
MGETIAMGVGTGADALVLHKGMIRFLDPILKCPPGVIMHLSASTRLGPAFDYKTLAGTVEEAIRLGADGVSIHVNLGGVHEPEMLSDLGMVADSCTEWQFPLLVMIYVGGDQQKPGAASGSDIAHGARIAAELGADIIKIPFPESYDVLSEITASLPVPVVVAGGTPAESTQGFFERVENVLAAGAAGVATGRNVFQHARPDLVLRAVCNIVHGGFTARQSWEQFRSDMQAKQPGARL